MLKTTQSFINTKGHQQSLRTKGSRTRWGFPDTGDKGPQSLIFKEALADEKSKGVAGSIKVR